MEVGSSLRALGTGGGTKTDEFFRNFTLQILGLCIQGFKASFLDHGGP